MSKVRTPKKRFETYILKTTSRISIAHNFDNNMHCFCFVHLSRFYFLNSEYTLNMSENLFSLQVLNIIVGNILFKFKVCPFSYCFNSRKSFYNCICVLLICFKFYLSCYGIRFPEYKSMFV